MSSLLRYEFQSRGSIHAHRQDRLQGQPFLYDYTEAFGRSRLGIPQYSKLDSILCFGQRDGPELDEWPLSAEAMSALRDKQEAHMLAYVESLEDGMNM